MEQLPIDLKKEYMRMLNATTTQQNNEIKKENVRKDIDLLLEVLGHHTTTTGYSESSSIEYIISDENHRGIITDKLLAKIKLL